MSRDGQPPRGRPRPARDRSFTLALRRHGVSAAIAHQVETVSTDLRHRAKLDGVEWSALFDLDAGVRVGALLRGEADEVDITTHVWLMQPQHRYLAVHTHLSSAAFSDTDAGALIGNVPLRTIVAVGVDGSSYFLSKTAGTVEIEAVTIVRLVRAAVVQVRTGYLPHVIAGSISRDEAKRHILDAVWRFLAPRLGLRYDRIGSDLEIDQ